ncbi:hypothetical protein ACIBL5_13425 [Streptomyces sp. NPDC050516]|uniref:hypothetical protein n=1 Tax=Streptomyces sp. NPDC050516 TaxID=3365621 RepID=UPI00378CDAB0
MAVIGGLLVSLGHTTDGPATMVAAVRSWLNRTGGTRRAVRLERDGDVLEMADATTNEQDLLVDVFVSRRISGAMQGEIEDIFSESRADDVVLLHFSCHGLKSESGELFFAARDTRPNRLGSTAVSADFVRGGRADRRPEP